MSGHCTSRHQDSLKANSWDGIRSIFPSGFQDALANNCPPRPGVLQTAKVFQEKPDFFLDASRKRIQEIEQQIEVLQGEKEKLADNDGARAALTEACATIRAPIRRISRDILREIAHHALATYPSSSMKHSPMNLSHVSSAWRAVVLDSPRLWTNLYVRIRSLHYRFLLKHVQAIDTCFGRAGGLPINLYLYVGCEVDVDDDLAQNFRLFLKAISSWTPRVARLGIGGQFWLSLMAHFADIKWDLPNLRTLEFLGQQANIEESIADEVEYLQSVAERITLFRTAKQLTTLIANQEITSNIVAFRFLPWSTLTHIDIDEHLSSQSDLWKILAVECPNLLSASLRWINGEHRFQPLSTSTRVTTLKHLELTIRPVDWNALPHFLSLFVFQSLTHLEVHVEDVLVDADDVVQPIVAMASFPSLTVLRLDSGFPMRIVIDLLRNTPHVRTFIMDFSGSSVDLDQLFDAITIKDIHANIIPLLEECSIKRRGDTVLLDVSTLSQFLRSRTGGLTSRANLKKLSLTGKFAFLTDIHQEVARIYEVENPALEVNTFPNFHPYHYHLEKVRLPRSHFGKTADFINLSTYSQTVRHDWYLPG